MARWFANRYVMQTDGLYLEVEFNRTSDDKPGWDWNVWHEDPSKPEAEGRSASLPHAQQSAERAAKRLVKGV